MRSGSAVALSSSFVHVGEALVPLVVTYTAPSLCPTAMMLELVGDTATALMY